MEWHERLNRALKEKGWSVPDLARELGSPNEEAVLNRLYKYTAGEVKNPRGTWMARIASAIGETEEYLQFGIKKNQNVGSDRPPNAPVQEVTLGPDVERSRGMHDIPVLGISVGGDETSDGREPDFWMNGEVVNYVARPRGLANAKNVFSVYIAGDSMYPRFRDRDLALLQKAVPAVGDDVVIELHPLSEGADHPSFIKEFVARRGSYIVVRQFNPPKEIEFSTKEIRNIFRVIPTKEWIG